MAPDEEEEQLLGPRLQQPGFLALRARPVALRPILTDGLPFRSEMFTSPALSRGGGVLLRHLSAQVLTGVNFLRQGKVLGNGA
jgi:hypothetical protein